MADAFGMPGVAEELLRVLGASVDEYWDSISSSPRITALRMVLRVLGIPELY